MKKDPDVFLKHILESIEWIEKDMAGLTKEEFYGNVPIQDAVIRRLEIIGQAVRNLPDKVNREKLDVPWQDIIDTRNVLIHHYFGVDLNTIWRIVKDDLPQLKEQVESMLKG